MRRYFSATALVIAILITAYFGYILTNIKGSDSSSFVSMITGPVSDTAFGGLLSSPYINDSLPHFKYKQIADSINSIKEYRERENNGIKSGESLGRVGAYVITKPDNSLYGSAEYNRIMTHISDSLQKLISDSLTRSPGNKNIDSVKTELRYEITQRVNDAMRIRFRGSEKQDGQYYLSLGGYTLHHDSRFYIDKGTYNLMYVKWDSVTKRKYDSTRIGHYESKQIPVRYAAGDNNILIPISINTYNILATLLKVAFIFLLFIGLYVFIGMPVQILLNISKGKAFTEKNIHMFRVMSIVLFISTIISIFGPYILHIVFYKLIPSEFKLPGMFPTLINNLYLILIALILFFISRAFKKGYMLQKEQELTV